jgi:peptidoglycan biosynthesis protein MviN/MurJ (putative lipid II flippase)
MNTIVILMKLSKRLKNYNKESKQLEIMKTFINFVRIASIIYCLVFMYRVIFLDIHIFEINMFGMAVLFLTLLIVDQLDQRITRREN